jgi:arabinan endo-1,5-alpha-L-arabinosidase
MGGATYIISSNKLYPGVGHNAVCTFDGQDYIILHAYEAAENGRPVLLVRELKWNDKGWPVVKL